MVWRKAAITTTTHSCGGPIFGRLAPAGDCKRCDELRSGVPAVKGWGAEKRADEERRLAAIRAHDCKKSGCGPVCVAFDW